MLVLVSCFIFQLTKIYSYTPFSGKEALDSTITTQDVSLKIYSANVLQKNNKYDLVLNQIAEKEPDIVLLMETNMKWKNGVHAMLSQKYPYQLLEPLDNTFGMLFYSKLPLTQAKIRHLVDKEIPSIEAIVTLRNGAEIQLYAIHPTPPMPQHNPMSSDRDTEMMKTAFHCK